MRSCFNGELAFQEQINTIKEYKLEIFQVSIISYKRHTFEYLYFIK